MKTKQKITDDTNKNDFKKLRIINLIYIFIMS